MEKAPLSIQDALRPATNHEEFPLIREEVTTNMEEAPLGIQDALRPSKTAKAAVRRSNGWAMNHGKNTTGNAGRGAIADGPVTTPATPGRRVAVAVEMPATKPAARKPEATAEPHATPPPVTSCVAAVVTDLTDDDPRHISPLLESEKLLMRWHGANILLSAARHRVRNLGNLVQSPPTGTTPTLAL